MFTAWSLGGFCLFATVAYGLAFLFQSSKLFEAGRFLFRGDWRSYAAFVKQWEGSDVPKDTSEEFLAWDVEFSRTWSERFFRALFRCTFCVGVWVGFLLAALDVAFWLEDPSFGVVLSYFILCGAASAAVSYIVESAIRRWESSNG